MNAGTEPTLEPLSLEECWALVASVPVGRVAVSVRGEAPLVVPVNHLVREKTILFRSAPGTKLELSRQSPLSFQADAFDPHHHLGWSVLVRGVANEAGDVDADTDPTPWAGGAGRRRLVRISPTHVSGRKIVAGELDWEPRGYM